MLGNNCSTLIFNLDFSFLEDRTAIGLEGGRAVGGAGVAVFTLTPEPVVLSFPGTRAASSAVRLTHRGLHLRGNRKLWG